MIEKRRSELTGDEYLRIKDEKGIRKFPNRVWIPNLTDLKRDILK